MKKYGIAALIALVLSVAITLVLLNVYQDPIIPQESIDNAPSVLSGLTLVPVNARLGRHREFTITGSEGQLFIEGIDRAFGALVVKLKRPVQKEAHYRLFHRTLGQEYSGHYLSGVIQPGTEALAIRLPEFACYDSMRLDTDTDYQISDICVIDDPAALYTGRSGLTLVRLDHSRFPLRLFAAGTLILLIQALLIAWMLPAKKARSAA